MVSDLSNTTILRKGTAFWTSLEIFDECLNSIRISKIIVLLYFYPHAAHVYAGKCDIAICLRGELLGLYTSGIYNKFQEFTWKRDLGIRVHQSPPHPSPRLGKRSPSWGRGSRSSLWSFSSLPWESSDGRKHRGRKAMTNLDSLLKIRDITLPTKVNLVEAMVFPVVMYACESWTIKKAEGWRIDAFELWCWRTLLRFPWIARRPNQSILRKAILNIHWKDWCRNCNTLANWFEELTLGKDTDVGKDWRQEE